MSYSNKKIAELLQLMDLGSSVAEVDTLLEVTRIETSAFADLLSDRVDLIPGTKGSGKSALFRIFVDFLPAYLLQHRKVVVAHGVQAPGDPVFHAFNEKFSHLSEQEFISFWCIYLVSLAHEQFIKGERYTNFLHDTSKEIEAFRKACTNARIPEIKARRTLSDVLQWALHVLDTWRPTVTYKSPDGSGDWQFNLFGEAPTVVKSNDDIGEELPKYVNDIKSALESILERCNLSLWLMIDRLDEIFPRRSELERNALRGLLRAMRYFASSTIRVKVFLRDDMIDQVVRNGNGFTALTHITVRQADTLRWTEDQILSMVVKRIFANEAMSKYLEVNREQLEASAIYKSQCFYKVFPPTVYSGPKQSPTLRWIYNRCADGKGVVTPRDVLDLLIRAKQRQYDLCTADPDSYSEWFIGPNAIQYGFDELSKKKRQTYLQAEFPHLWTHIEKFVGGKTEYDEQSIRSVLGKDWFRITEDLVSIGLFFKRTKAKQYVYSIPFLYRQGLDVTQGKA